jgi:two-component system OmpR family sensor kinase
VRHRLYWRLYVTLLASAFVCLLVTGVAFRLLRDVGVAPVERMQQAARALSEQLPDVRASDARARIAAIADQFGLDIIAGDASGPLVGVPGPRAFSIPRHLGAGLRHDRIGPVLMTSFEGEDWAALRPRGPYRRLRMHPFFATLAVLAVVMAVGSYPVARRVARRLETLTGGVERWGHGELHARVPVEGNDEVAILAATFNRAAERLDLLLGQQRQMLANASHELRSPLARLRMGLEIIAEEPDGERRQKLVRQIHGDIVELDGLIEELLLYARADDRVPHRPPVAVDLRALVSEEAARTGAVVDGDGVTLEGDASMLRHLVRNLLENAHRHAGGAAVRVSVTSDAAAARLSVDDRGPGVPEDDRERIFAPFFRRHAGGEPTNGQGDGHGLGLALVRQVAHYHGGEVAYHPRPEGGSRFEVTLPLRAPSSAALG